MEKQEVKGETSKQIILSKLFRAVKQIYLREGVLSALTLDTQTPFCLASI